MTSALDPTSARVGGTTHPNGHPPIGVTLADIAKTIEELKRANAEMETKIREVEEALNKFPDPDSEPDTDGQEIEKLEGDSADKIQNKGHSQHQL